METTCFIPDLQKSSDMPNPNMRLYIYYKMHGAQEDFPKLTSRWLPKGTGNMFIYYSQ